MVELQALVDAQYDRDELWEAAVSAGLLPESWLDSPARSYTRQHRDQIDRGQAPERHTRPFGRRQAVEVILAQEEMVTYELLVHELLAAFARISGWAPGPFHIVWNECSGRKGQPPSPLYTWALTRAVVPVYLVDKIRRLRGSQPLPPAKARVDAWLGVYGQSPQLLASYIEGARSAWLTLLKQGHVGALAAMRPEIQAISMDRRQAICHVPLQSARLGIRLMSDR